MTTTTIESIKPIEAIDFHQHPPMSLSHLRARHRWILPVATTAFLLLAVGATLNLLPWDRPITNMAVDARTAWLTGIFRKISFLWLHQDRVPCRRPRSGGGVEAVSASRVGHRGHRLARPLAEWALKELVESRAPDRRPPRGRGRGHRFRVAIRSRRPRAGACCRSSPRCTRSAASVWWSIAIAAWTLAVLVAARGRARGPLAVRRRRPACCLRSSGWPARSGSSRRRTALGRAQGPRPGGAQGPKLSRCSRKSFCESNDADENGRSSSPRGSRGTAACSSRRAPATAPRGTARRPATRSADDSRS